MSDLDPEPKDDTSFAYVMWSQRQAKAKSASSSPPDAAKSGDAGGGGAPAVKKDKDKSKNKSGGAPAGAGDASASAGAVPASAKGWKAWFSSWKADTLKATEDVVTAALTKQMTALNLGGSGNATATTTTTTAAAAAASADDGTKTALAKCTSELKALDGKLKAEAARLAAAEEKIRVAGEHEYEQVKELRKVNDENTTIRRTEQELGAEVRDLRRDARSLELKLVDAKKTISDLTRDVESVRAGASKELTDTVKFHLNKRDVATARTEADFTDGLGPGHAEWANATVRYHFIASETERAAGIEHLETLEKQHKFPEAVLRAKVDARRRRLYHEDTKGDGGYRDIEMHGNVDDLSLSLQSMRLGADNDVTTVTAAAAATQVRRDAPFAFDPNAIIDVDLWREVSSHVGRAKKEKPRKATSVPTTAATQSTTTTTAAKTVPVPPSPSSIQSVAPTASAAPGPVASPAPVPSAPPKSTKTPLPDTVETTLDTKHLAEPSTPISPPATPTTAPAPLTPTPVVVKQPLIITPTITTTTTASSRTRSQLQSSAIDAASPTQTATTPRVGTGSTTPLPPPRRRHSLTSVPRPLLSPSSAKAPEATTPAQMHSDSGRKHGRSDDPSGGGGDNNADDPERDENEDAKQRRYLELVTNDRELLNGRVFYHMYDDNAYDRFLYVDRKLYIIEVRGPSGLIIRTPKDFPFNNIPAHHRLKVDPWTDDTIDDLVELPNRCAVFKPSDSPHAFITVSNTSDGKTLQAAVKIDDARSLVSAPVEVGRDDRTQALKFDFKLEDYSEDLTAKFAKHLASRRRAFQQQEGTGSPIFTPFMEKLYDIEMLIGFPVRDGIDKFAERRVDWQKLQTAKAEFDHQRRLKQRAAEELARKALQDRYEQDRAVKAKAMDSAAQRYAEQELARTRARSDYDAAYEKKTANAPRTAAASSNPRNDTDPNRPRRPDTRYTRRRVDTGSSKTSVPPRPVPVPPPTVTRAAIDDLKADKRFELPAFHGEYFPGSIGKAMSNKSAQSRRDVVKKMSVSTLNDAFKIIGAVPATTFVSLSAYVYFMTGLPLTPDESRRTTKDRTMRILTSIISALYHPQWTGLDRGDPVYDAIFDANKFTTEYVTKAFESVVTMGALRVPGKKPATVSKMGALAHRALPRVPFTVTRVKIFSSSRR